MFKYLGLALVLVTWLAGAYLITKWRDRTLPTISRHAASSKRASLLFAAVLIICGLLFYLWIVRWFVPHLHLGILFDLLITFTIVCQIVTALAPDTHGISRAIHRYAAYTMAVFYLPLVALVIAAPGISPFGRIVCILAGIYMLTTFFIIAIFGKAKSHYLLFQALYVMVFQIAILVAAYV